MCKTIFITTTEQATAMLEHLDDCKQAARVDDYAEERRRPIKWMTCTCCGESYQGRQWWNQDCGYGLGDCCVKMCCGMIPAAGEEVESESYGVAGIHFLIPQTEKDNPPVIEDRGQPLYGLDERLRIECDGYVFWKGVQVEHYDGSLSCDCEASRVQGRELLRRCEVVEGRGDVVNMGSVIWTWEEETEKGGAA